MMRIVLAAIAGVVAMMLSVFVVESIGHTLFPPPPNMDVSNPEMLKALMPSLPFGALAFVILGWALGAFLGAVVASRITLKHQQKLAIGIGIVMIALSVTTMVMIPHPLWMIFLGVTLPVPSAWLGARISTPQTAANAA
jgi:hypothetical protein